MKGSSIAEKPLPYIKLVKIFSKGFGTKKTIPPIIAAIPKKHKLHKSKIHVFPSSNFFASFLNSTLLIDTSIKYLQYNFFSTRQKSLAKIFISNILLIITQAIKYF